MNQGRTEKDPVFRVLEAYRMRHGEPPAVAAFAPGRVEILGNHTDYNEGFVLSAALEMGMVFAVGKSADIGRSTIYALDFQREASFRTEAPLPDIATKWANYSKGVLHLLQRRTTQAQDFSAVFGGNIPVGAGLSSSAALEISTGLALAQWLQIDILPLDLARIGQQAEHDFAGARVGLLDQISSLFGRKDALVFTDFRSLEIRSVTLPKGLCFLLCNTGVKHSLVESEYNERRQNCEAAALRLGAILNRPVAALRDVLPAELESARSRMNEVTYRRAAHVVGENDRVLRGIQALERGEGTVFGRLMTESHESSRLNFNNSCPELDEAVASVLALDGVYGARLSGGGFGGSVVALVHLDRADEICAEWGDACSRKWNAPVDILRIQPGDGARILPSDAVVPPTV